MRHVNLKEFMAQRECTQGQPYVPKDDDLVRTVCHPDAILLGEESDGLFYCCPNCLVVFKRSRVHA